MEGNFTLVVAVCRSYRNVSERVGCVKIVSLRSPLPPAAPRSPTHQDQAWTVQPGVSALAVEVIDSGTVFAGELDTPYRSG